VRRVQAVVREPHSMKRVFQALGLALGIVLIAGILFVILSLSNRQAITDGFESDGVRIIKDGSGSVGVLSIGEREVALIDAGVDRAGKAILAELSRRGLGVGSVKVILLTHGHPDHVAAAPLFPNAEIMALESEADLIEGRAHSRGPVTRLLPAQPGGLKVGRVLHDGETLTLGHMTVRVFAVPGHTAGSAAYLINGLLFLGDSADALSSGRVRGAAWIFSDDTARNRASLARLAERLRREGAEVRGLVFSHSGVLISGDEALAALTGRR
jgi:glyoxylase-like metal-dependent hydrolase (beta-lactamase superfamily II)